MTTPVSLFQFARPPEHPFPGPAPLIVRGMRKGVPAKECAHFAPLYSNESDWKKFVNFSTPDDAYLVVAAPAGHSLWQVHGPYSDATYSDFKKTVATLLVESSIRSPKN